MVLGWLGGSSDWGIALGAVRPGWLRQRGLLYWADLSDFDQRLIVTGSFDSAVENAVLRQLSGSGVFLDIGANVGYLSLTAAARRPGTRVLAVEPNPCIAAILRMNVERNRLAQAISVMELACGEKAGAAPFFVSSVDHSGRSSFSQSNAGAQRQTIIVPRQTVDAIVETLSLPVELVKIDVEGYELAVLKGMERTISMFRPSVLIEMEPTLLAAFGVDVSDIDDHLVSRGYTKHPVGTADALFVPSHSGS